MKKKITQQLSFRFLVGFLLLAISISAVSCNIGFFKYRSTIQRLYNENSYAIAGIAQNSVDGFQLSSLLARDGDGNLIRERENADGSWSITHAPYQKGDRYQVTESGGASYAEMSARLNSIRKGSNAQYILLYIPVPDPETPHLVYYFDAENDFYPQNQLGMTDPMNPKYFDDVLGIYETGEHSDSYFISHSDYGYTTSAMLPIQDGSGHVVAILDVYVPMTLITSTLMEYIWTVIVATVALVFLFVFLYLNYLRRRVILPITRITQHAAGFVQSGFSSEELSIHTGDEIETLALALGQMEIDLSTYIRDLTAVTAEKERIGAELNVATQIQADMLPSIFPAFPGRMEFDIFATMEPAKEVGGDFYDFFLVDDDHLAVVIADVSGKGVPAALFMVIAKTLIKNHAQNNESLADIFTNTNTQLCENNKEGMFVTGWMGLLEISTGNFRFVNAGHNPPLLMRAGGEFAYLESAAGFVLAGLDGIRYRQNEMQLAPGDTLYLYTDGVTEAINTREELYGEERLLAVLNQNTKASPAQLLPLVKGNLDQFVGEAAQFDDITMLCLNYKSTGKAAE
ncbi:MAG: SpoIIE family protein phosphatase [Oscillospiraceae bacterium]